MDLDGLDALLAKLDRMNDEIEDDVGEIVKNNTIEMTGQTLKNERQRFDKGYWTGFTARNTVTHREDTLHYKTLVESDYAGFLNYGTRFISPTWFLRDSFNAQKKKFLDDLDKLVK